MRWLSLAEWWYNTNHHYAINITPYEIVYDQSLPIYVPYVGEDSSVELVDRSLTVREEAMEVAYKLKFPDLSQIHNVFHISQLKKCKGVVPHSGGLPDCNEQGVLVVEPLAILDRRMAKRGNVVVVFVLVQWTNGSKEPIEEIQKNFPSFNFDLEDKIDLRGMDCYKLIRS
nr:reverse transcriptase [Tanacetum cinerariifolium]